MSFSIVLFAAMWGLITFTYIVFPLLLALIVRLRRPQAGDEEQSAAESVQAALPSVAMVVAAFNEAKVLDAKLNNTRRIDYPLDRFQVLIGSDGSEDGTNAILRQGEDSRIKAILFPKRRGKISVLNDLMEQVQADIVVLSDANTMLAPDAVR